MIFSTILKYWKKILDIAIIIALVILIFLWNPFGIFGGSSTLQPTANMVGSIKSVGQLVTAEYYGEVIASLNEARLNLLVKDSLNTVADEQFVEIKNILLNVCLYDTLTRKERKAAKEESKGNDDGYGWFQRNDLYLDDASKDNIVLKFDHFKNSIFKSKSKIDTLICYLASVTLNKKIEKPDFGRADKYKRDVLYLLFTEVKDKRNLLKPDEFDIYLSEGLPYKTKYGDFRTEVLSNTLPKRDLTMIGRGWVKAGINFEKLNEDNFYFDKDRGLVHLFGLNTEILYYDINPWFIPQRAVPGYQIIEYNKEMTFEDAKKVKGYCKQKLQDYALKAQIIEQARENAVEALKNFITLVSGVEVKNVFFHEDKLAEYYKRIIEDKQISYDEATLIDSIANREITNIEELEKDSAQYGLGFAEKRKLLLKKFLIDLQKFNYIENNKTKRATKFNFYTVKYRDIVRDSILDTLEMQQVKNLRWSITKAQGNDTVFQLPGNIENQVWFENGYAFMDYYNSLVDSTKIGNAFKYSINYDPKKIKELIETDVTGTNFDSLFQKNLLNPQFNSISSLQKEQKQEYNKLKEYIIHQRDSLYPAGNAIQRTYSDLKRKLKTEGKSIAEDVRELIKVK